MKPCAFFPDPFRGGDNIIVLTECYNWEDQEFKNLKPSNTNFRSFVKPIFEATQGELPWYGIEQEYTLLDQENRFTTHPHGWPKEGYPGN